MSLRGRLLMLLVAILVVVAAGGLVGGLIVAGRDRDNTKLRLLTEARRRVDELTTTYTEQQNAVIGYLVTGQDLLLRPYTSGVPTSAALLHDLRADLRSTSGTRAPLAAIDADATWLREHAADPAIALRRSGRTAEALGTVLAPPVTRRFDGLRTRLRALGQRVDREARHRNDRRNTANHWLLVTLIATVAGIVGALVGATVLIARWTKRPIDRIAAAVRSVQHGELDTPVPATGPPELAALGRDVDEMRARIIRQLNENRRAREALEQNATVVLTLRRLLETELPELPAGWHVAASLRPVEGVVAGDAYDVAVLADGRVAVVVIDVAGHGAVSAVAALRCQELLRIALGDGRDPGDALTWLLDQIRDPGAELFFSAFVTTVDPVTGRCRYANAGHPAPLLRRDGRVEALAATGPIVGPLPATWETREVVLEEGAALAVYTDGLTDPRNTTGGREPIDALTARLRDSDCDADAIVGRSLADLELHSAGDLRDDVTLVVLCRVGPDD